MALLNVPVKPLYLFVQRGADDQKGRFEPITQAGEGCGVRLHRGENSHHTAEKSDKIGVMMNCQLDKNIKPCLTLWHSYCYYIEDEWEGRRFENKALKRC